MRARILILNYEGRDLLETYLPSIVEAAKRSPVPCAVTVIDNASQDTSLDYLKTHFPSVDIFASKENKVLCTYNDAAAICEEEVLIFMNNDIRVDSGFVGPLVEPFGEDPNVFFVTPRCLNLETGAYEGNRTWARIRRGVFWSSSVYPGHEKHISKPGLTFHGGFGAVDRKKFLELGGYDALYLPGRLEDADLCFRARKRGWKCLYEPASVVYHEGGASFHKRFGIRKTLVINWRNTFLFMHKNLSDRAMWVSFWIWLPIRIAFSILSGKPELAIGFFQSLSLWGRARRARPIYSSGAPADRVLFEEIPA